MTARLPRLPIALAVLAAAVAALRLGAPPPAEAQTVVPGEFRAAEQFISRGVLDGNLIETNFRNHGEFSRFGDAPHGVWPRFVGNSHIDGIGTIIAGRVPGERVKWGLASTDTTLTPVILLYRDSGRRRGPNDDLLYGWLPIEGFNNPNRTDPVTGLRRPTPALSDDDSSWPAFWPDRLDNPDDPGWRYNDVDMDPTTAAWNGIFGKGVFNADLEAFYVMNDHSDFEYGVSPRTGRPNSPLGVFYPTPSDSTMGGLGLQVSVRSLQWANVLSEDLMFILYQVTNVGAFDHDQLYFAQIADYGLGEGSEEGDENVAFNPQLDVAYGWDQDGLCRRSSGVTYDCGYTGFAFLESPARPLDGLDNDEDGVRDEERFGGPGQLVEGQAAIESFVRANYDTQSFASFNGRPGENESFEEVLASRPAFQAGRWWTGDENLDWVGFDDASGNGAYDPGEAVNDDRGLDGLGPRDLGYPGPDTGEGDGVPSAGEPNFDRTDVDESDQIGLTGFDLNSRPFYESGQNLKNDQFLWERIQVAESRITLGDRPAGFEADLEPFVLFTSGPVGLLPFRTDPSLSTDFFSTAWVFGANEEDFFRNRRTAQQIYNADYQFAQPPITPTLTAQAGDGRVVLTWDAGSLQSFDRFTQEEDFEGFKLYRGTDPLLSDVRTLTDVNGTPTFYEPLAQFDLDNGVRGTVNALGGDIRYDLGDDTGLQFFYVDDDVQNGFTYYYALVAYDRGGGLFGDADGDGRFERLPGADDAIEPQENVFNISVNNLGRLAGISPNAAVVTPRSDAAGVVGPGAEGDLSRVTGVGTGSASVEVFNEGGLEEGAVYRVNFFSEQAGTSVAQYRTSAFEVVNVTTGETVLERRPFTASSPPIQSTFTVRFDNDDEVAIDFDRTGWVASPGTDEERVARDPADLGTYRTNLLFSVREDFSEDAAFSPFDFEVRWLDPSEPLYEPPRFRLGTYLREEIPIAARNATTGEPAELLIRDLNGSGAFEITEDALVIAERTDGRCCALRDFITFRAPGGAAPIAPEAGALLRVARTRPFRTGDFFQFSLRASQTDAQLAAEQLADIRVVPNPYVAASQFERISPRLEGRGERQVQFRGLPAEATVRIFNVRGELIRTLRHSSLSGSGQLAWDLKTEENLDIASGVYVYHVDAPGVGEHVGRIGIVK